MGQKTVTGSHIRWLGRLPDFWNIVFRFEIDTQARFSGHLLQWIFHLPDFHFFFRHLYDALYHRDVSNPYLLVKSLTSFMVHDNTLTTEKDGTASVFWALDVVSQVMLRKRSSIVIIAVYFLINNWRHIFCHLLWYFFEKSLLVSVHSSKPKATDKWLSFWPCVNICDMN
jgi:hypothetical protein